VTDERISELRAVAHPLRLRLLSLLTGAPMSSAEAARELGISQANASYHLRLLERAGLVEVAEEVKVRGGRARRYREVASRREQSSSPESEVAKASTEAREVFVRALVDELVRRNAHRVMGPVLDVDAELWVPSETWKECVNVVGEVAVRLHAAARKPRTPGAERVAVTVSMFPMDAS
jgi:DNA-binding transcriptional ArsR family regulator